MMKKRDIVAILISDLHFTVATLDIATAALLQAFKEAEEAGIPLVIAGDTLDNKSIIRAECANRLIDIFSQFSTTVYLLVGNHDLLCEKSNEHALNFLQLYCILVDEPMYSTMLDSYLIPYQNDTEKFHAYLKSLPKHSRLIIHQGVTDANMGHYVQDKTAMPKEAFSDFRVISGHYHRAQDIKCGHPRKGAVGLFSYIGTAYTTTYAEAHDGPKGYQRLYSDGLLELVPTNLRKHVIVERTSDNLFEPISNINPSDLLWVKYSGFTSERDKLNKNEIGAKLIGHSNFKLDFIPKDSHNKVMQETVATNPSEILDNLVDQTPESEDRKNKLKLLWRSLLDP